MGDGKIVFAAYEGAYGNKIAIQHPDGTVTWYAHLSEFLKTSGTVKAGDAIGRIGTTGNTTGPHLHLEVRPGDGGPVPPLTWLREHGVRSEPSRRDRRLTMPRLGLRASRPARSAAAAA